MTTWKAIVLLVVLAAGPLGAAATEDTVEALVAAGGRSLAAGDLESAEKRFQEAAEAAPRHMPAWLGLAEARERLGKAMEALEAARRAQELAPRDPAVLLAVGGILVRLGAAPEALRTFAEVRAIDPQNVDGSPPRRLRAARRRASSGGRGASRGGPWTRH